MKTTFIWEQIVKHLKIKFDIITALSKIIKRWVVKYVLVKQIDLNHKQWIK